MNDVPAASASAWEKEIGSELLSDENTGSIMGDMRPSKALLSSYSPDGGLLLLSKEMMSIAVESSADHRPSAVDPEDNQYKVEKLVRKRRMRGKVQYLVKWLGYPDNENTWEAINDINPDLVAAFETNSLKAQLKSSPSGWSKDGSLRLEGAGESNF